MLRAIARAGAVLTAATVFACSDSSAGPGGSQGPQPLVFSNFQTAAVVIGQPDGMSGAINAGVGTGPATLGNAVGTVAFGSLYVPDPNNHRVLGFRAVPTADGTAADFVLGQPDFMSNSSGTSATKFNAAYFSAAAGGKLFLSEAKNNRVLIWNTLPTTTGTPADVVVGQANFTSSAAATTRSGFNLPAGVAVAGGKLFVADVFNNRLLIWNTIPTANGALADVVLGQTDFTSGTPPYRNAASVYSPRAVWTDGTHLVVGEGGSLGRVLIWNAIPTTNGAPADLVVGAPDFTTVGSLDVWGVASDGTSLYVSDAENNRVLIYPFPTANDPAPTGVLGQSNFTNIAPNDDDQDGNQDANPTRRTFYYPSGLAISGSQLFVAEQVNNRILVFTSQ